MQSYDEGWLETTLDFIKKYQLENGRSPSFREIMRAYPAFFTSVSKVERYVKILSGRGLISKENNGCISIVENLAMGKTVKVSLIGSCACGSPMLAEQNIEGTYSIPCDLLGKGDFFMLRAVGSSMRDAGIFDRDFMFVRKQDTAENGQIVIALVDGKEDATAKRFFKQKNKIILHPENDDEVDGERVYQDIVVDDCTILGVVTNVWHDVK